MGRRHAGIRGVQAGRVSGDPPPYDEIELVRRPSAPATTTPVANTGDTPGDGCPTSNCRTKPSCIGDVQKSEGGGVDKHRVVGYYVSTCPPEFYPSDFQHTEV